MVESPAVGVLVPRVGYGASSVPTAASGKQPGCPEKEQKEGCVPWVSTQPSSFRLELARVTLENSVRDRSRQEVREPGTCSRVGSPPLKLGYG